MTRDEARKTVMPFGRLAGQRLGTIAQKGSIDYAGYAYLADIAACMTQRRQKRLLEAIVMVLYEWASATG